MIKQVKAKPLFSEEKAFIESHLPEIGTLPDNCWITGGALNSYGLIYTQIST